MKLEVNKIKRIARLFLLIFVIMLIGSVFFLYRYFYQTLTQANVVVLLKSQVSPYVLNIKVWKKVMNSLEYKKSPLVNINKLPPNPFKGVESTTTSAEQ